MSKTNDVTPVNLLTEKYDVLFGYSEDALVAKVNKRLKDGWELFGRPFERSAGGVYQALVKYSDAATAEGGTA